METDAHPATGLSAIVAKEIRIMLVRLDLKQSELAARLGVNEMWLSRRLRGAQPIDLNDLQRIADALGVVATDLMPLSREGRTVVVAGDARRQTTVPKAELPKQSRPNGHPTNPVPKQSTRRPVLLTPAYA